ncbi:cache domain-containing protein [Paraneptunicella aestuarii]|uniref:cache domain-containing protein n=1 Tax=Paraneptunicella aestuarii TaxID=2831148 RepID=UPI001E55FD8F|nr:cache domain-containing protein [Paraneptunicella aestuarii]UAA38981.1 cache domain-containing protein [Paraneptunicella aestuarii]
MRFPLKLIFAAIAQVIITAWITYYFVAKEYQSLSYQSLDSLESFLLKQKEKELKNYLDISVSAVKYVSHNLNDRQDITKDKISGIFNNMLYSGDDGYFFVYDSAGTAIAHPKEPFRVGRSYWDLEDSEGIKTIQVLIENALAGGGIHIYPWNKPSTNTTSQKMGYTTYLEEWDWMIGTGVYLDDIDHQIATINNEITRHIQKTQKIILTVTITSILSIFLFGIINNLRQKHKNDAQISLLGQRIITMQEEERRHISRELHDGIIQMMVSVRYSLEATALQLKKDNREKPEQLSQAHKDLGTAINEIRRISHHLHPKILDELGLSAAIDNLIRDFSNRTGIKVTFSKPVVRKILPVCISTTLYRVAQEALINIEKHANATEVLIDLQIQVSKLILTIEDNGSGFKQTSNSIRDQLGIGLRNLSERVEYNEGEFDVVSSEKGTRICAQIPRHRFANHFKLEQSRNAA